jgi:hypothetical protein
MKKSAAAAQRVSIGARLARAVTALMIIAACAVIAMRGWSIAQFAFAYAELDDNADLHEPLAPWKDEPGLSFVEREATLTQVGSWDDIAKTAARRDELSELLAVKPMSPGFWLSLARMRFASSEDMGSVARALEMSVLTGANEGSLMWQRAGFDFMLWHALPPNVRARAASELMDDSLSNEQAASLRAQLAEKSPSERQEIRELLQSRGLSAKFITMLGLSTSEPSSSRGKP